ncbi:cellulose binding domain-containing protein [Clostridium paraputrificum]|uniref:cellulose binding domain-containing protein n=1 Tax=Clostridium paraputrificum TaxID=29363 RepID=UPI00325B131C
MHIKKRIKRMAAFVVFLGILFTLMPCKLTSASASGVPGKPTLSSDQYGVDYDGDYNITMNMYYGNNATSYKLYERYGINGEYRVISEGELTDGTPAVQSKVLEVRGRQNIGIYSYYAEFINSYGSTCSDVLEVRVGKDGDAKIIIDKVDNEGIQYQTTIAQCKESYKITNRKNTSSKFSVISSNTSVVKASIEEGNILVVEGVSAGRSGIKIVDESTGDIRQIGFRVKNSDGSLPGMPDYLSIGQVSEDTDNDLNFWKDTSNNDTNKRCDIRYIYVNGGPFGGWRSWTTEDGDRVKSYIRESLKLGMIPFFVYYNIPDSGESYELDLKHINDKAYMEGYYKDLKFFLDICNEYAGDETVGMIFEPDFLGYMMQQNKKDPSTISALVDTAYTSGVLEKGKDPTFENSVKGLVESINYTVRKEYKNAYFGWQFNIWSYDSTEIPNQGLLHKTEFIGWDNGRQFIKQVAQETADYYKSAGITSYDADFISIDKYGLDGAYEDNAATNPEGSKWLWNADIWNNYLLYTKTLHEVTEKPVILWQIPVGHLNSSEEPNPYNGGKFDDLTNAVGNYEDSAPTYFFGDTFNASSDARKEYFSKNLANDSKIKVEGNKITWGDHMEETKDAGVVSILFGAGVNASTDAVGSPAPDNYWWITKAQRYLKNPLSLDSTINPPTPSDEKPLSPEISSSSLESNGNYTLSVKIQSNSKAKEYKLYENGKVIKNGSVTTSETTIRHEILNKPTGTYMYQAELINGSASSISQIITVKVSNNVVPPIDVPLKATLEVDKSSNDGNYNLTISIPEKSNATSYNLYEDDKIIKTGDVSTLSQVINVNFTNKIKGTYVYRVDLINKDATTKGDTITVNCNPTVVESGVKVEYATTADWGTGANFQITIFNNTDMDLVDWTLRFDFDKKINSIPDVNFTQNGSTYTITPKSWNNVIPKGGKLVLFGGCEGNVNNLNIYNVKVN